MLKDAFFVLLFITWASASIGPFGNLFNTIPGMDIELINDINTNYDINKDGKTSEKSIHRFDASAGIQDSNIKTPKTATVGTEPTPKSAGKYAIVRWDSDCSARNVHALQNEDIILRCSFWAPLGSTVRWLEDGEVVREQIHDVPEQNIRRNDGIYEKEFHLMTFLIQYCYQIENHEYELTIQTPGGNIFSRSFKIWNKLETISKYRNLETNSTSVYCCEMCKYFSKFSPKIIEFAKTVIGRLGERLALPCRREGVHKIRYEWTHKKKILTSDNYMITSNGDLMIKKLSRSDNGIFTCIIGSGYNDSISTFVMVV